MKQITALLIILGVFASTTAKDIELVQYSDLRLQNESQQITIYGTWVLTGEHSFPDGVQLTISPDQISGSDGCNRFSASLMVAGDALKIGPIMSTRAFCDNLNGNDHAFTQTLSKVTKFILMDDGTLQLLNGAKEILLTLQQ